MDIYRILEKLAVISNKQTLTEGQMKRSLEARAEKMSKADFVANAGEYGMSAEEAAEFWAAVNGEEEVDEAYEKLPKDQLGLDKFSQAALSGGQRKRDALANPKQTVALAKASARNRGGVAEGSPPGGFKAGDKIKVDGQKGPTGSNVGTFVRQLLTTAGQKPFYAFRFDDKKYPEGTYDTVSANHIYPADGVAESKGSKPDFLDLDRDGDKKEPMKKAAQDKNDAKGSFQKQMGGSARDLTKGLSVKPKSDKDLEESALQAYLGKKKYGSEGMKALQQAGRDGAGKEKMAKIRARHDKMDEADMEEGNKFAHNVLKAKAAGIKKADLDGDGDMETVREMFPGTPEYELRFGKDDASSAFDKKKISTGTVYSRKHQEEPEADDDDTPKKKGRPVGAKRRLGAKGPGVDSKLLKGKGGLKEQETDTASDAILPLLKKFISIKSDPEDKQDLIKVYRAFEKSTALGMEKLKDQWGTNLDAEFYHYAKQNGLDMNDFDSEVNENIDPADQGEYDREGDMALNQIHQIADAAEELHSILDADENLPEWVQSKITKAVDYLDTARDYLKAKGDQAHEMIPEKAVSRAQQQAAGAALAAKRGGGKAIGASKEMAKMSTKELEKFASTKHKGLPKRTSKVEEESADTRDDRAERAGKRVAKDIEYDEKKKDGIHGRRRDAEDSKAEKAGKKVAKDIEHDEKVDETTVAGSVATGGEAPKSKGGMQFGKGVYEGALAESFEKKMKQLNEGYSVNVSVDDGGRKNITVTASDEQADQLGQMLKMAGLFSSEGYSQVCQHCGGIHEANACGAEQVDEELANAPDEQYSDADTMLNTLSGGLNGPKLQSNPNNMGDNPLAMRRLGKTASPSLNLGDMAESVEKESTTRLWDLYKGHKSK